MANKRKSLDKRETIIKRGKTRIQNKAENRYFNKRDEINNSVIKNENQRMRIDILSKDSGDMNILNQVEIKNNNLSQVMNLRDEGHTNLSWLVNLSAASLFNNIQPKQESADNDQTISYEASLKPGLTYTELIEKALKEHGELTVSEIYKWIYSKYPYYKKNDGRWKNSIRHNLSINPQFRKGVKCNNGGHFWTLNKEYDEQFKKWQENKKTAKVDKRKKMMPKAEEDEIEIATRSIMLHEDNSNESIYFPNDTEKSLVRVATDILSGVDKQVEVEYMNRLDCATAPLVIEEEMMECSDPMLADPFLFSDCLELGFQPYELIDSRL